MKPKYTKFDAVVMIKLYSLIQMWDRWHMQVNLKECFEINSDKLMIVGKNKNKQNYGYF